MDQHIKTDILQNSIMEHARSDIPLLRVDETVGEALEALRTQDLRDRILYLYVVDKAGRLVGVAPMRRFLTAAPGDKIGGIMVTGVVSVPESSTVLEACEMLLEHRFLALPIVDKAGKPVGLVDVNLFAEEVGALARKGEVNNAFQLIGVHVILGREAPAWISFRDRFPWLLCNISSGLICALVAGPFEGLIRQVTLLAFFITVVLALAESVGMQSMTITVQGLAAQQPSMSRLMLALRRELSASALLALACGGLVGGVAFLWKGAALPAVVIGASIAASIGAACVLGVAVPTAIRAMKLDPKVASGPIVLASADIITTVCYFNLAKWLLA